MKHFTKISALLFAVAVFAAGCGKEDKPVSVTGITLNRTTVSMHVGDRDTLTATIAPENANAKTVVWASSDPAVAVVSDGIITAVAAGQSNITATADGKTATCNVTVEHAVYVAGTVLKNGTAVAEIWINGTAQDITDGTSQTAAYSVFVSDNNDVYVAGAKAVSGADGKIRGVAKLWKNGAAQNDLTDGQEDALVNSVFVSGNDVYAVGYNGQRAVFWKNGTAQNLTDGRFDEEEEEAHSVFVSNNVPFIAGYECVLQENEDGQTYMTEAKIWRIGGTTYTLGYGKAKSVFVSNNFIYAVFEESETNMLKLWKCNKDGGTPEITNITDGTKYAYVYSVFVSGNDVYTAGYESDYRTPEIAKLWKNGSPQNLSNGTIDARACSVYVTDGDVYVAGYEGKIAKLWKNGSPQNLTDGTNDGVVGLSVFVK